MYGAGAMPGGVVFLFELALPWLREGQSKKGQAVVDRGPVQSREYGYCGVMGAQEIVDFLEPGRYRSVTIF